MADNATASASSNDGVTFALDEVTYSGDTALIGLSRLVHVAGAEGAKTVSEVFFAEDTAHSAGDYGLMPLAVRNDTLAALATTDGDYSPLQVNASGALYIQEGSALDVSAATVTVDLGANNDVVQATHDNFNANANVQQGDADVAAGNPLEVTLANGSVPSHAVTNAGTFAVQVDGAALTALQLIDDVVLTEDAAHTTGENGIMPLAVRNDLLATLAGTDGDYAPLQVDQDGVLYVSEPNRVDDSNSSTSTLLSGATFTGTATEVLGFRNVSVGVFSDQSSAADGLKIQFSSDGTNWDHEEDFTVTGGTSEHHTVPVMGRYFRVVYTNGGTGQSTFRLESILVVDDITGTVAPLNTTIEAGNQAVLTRSVIAAENPSNDYVNIAATNGGSLKISLEEADGLAGQAAMAGSIPVAIASDQSALDVSAATIDSTISGDALTALQTIDNPVFADDSAFTLTSSSVMVGGAIRDDSLSTLSAIEGDAVPLRVSSTGALHVTGGGGGTQYSVDDASPTVVTMAGVVRDDSLTTLTEADGDASVLRVSSTGALHVTGGGGGTEYTEDVATPNPIVGTATMMERDDALSTVTPVEGDWIGLRGSAEGALWTQDFNSDTMLTRLTDIETNTDFGVVTGGGVEATALRVTLANDSTGVLSVDDGGGALTVDNGGTFAVQVDAALPAGTNAIGKLAANSGVDIGDVDVTSISAGTNLIGDVGIQGRTTGGLSIFRSLDLDETEEEVKSTAGTVYSVVAFNMTAGPFFLKLYNLTAASTTVGTSTPVITIPIPANADSDGAGFVFTIPQGIAFGTAISAAVTTGVADSDTTGPGENEAVVNIFYK